MKRSTRFLIGLAAAAITYGSLTAFVGPRHFGGRCGYTYQTYGGERYDHCRGMTRNHVGVPGESQPSQGGSTPNP